MGKCPNCGVTNLESATMCRMCGFHLVPAPVADPKEWRCNFCGSMNPVGSRRCSVCMKRVDFRVKAPLESRKRELLFWPRGETGFERPKTMGPVLAGILMIACAIMGLGSVLVIWIFYASYEPEFADILMPLNILFTLFAVVTLVAGFASIARKFWPLAELGGLLSIVLGLYAPLILCVGTLIMGFAAFLFVSMSRQEFS